jgi:catechol 2,3-dioxygenase-like lactoylglutathione lyase family enzyme
MKRFHVHLRVADLERSVPFYTRVLGAEPTVRKPDYAKWMLDDPRLNFAISARGGEAGLDHLGLQVDTVPELAEVRERFAAADATAVVDQAGASCCYARSDKHWITDPQGIAWEGYRTLEDIRYFDRDTVPEPAPAASACRTGDSPRPASDGASCCPPAPAAVAFRPRNRT